LAAYLKQYEKTNKNTLLVSVGDQVGASPTVSALLQDKPTIEIMNKIGFDVATVGNHEFDEGTESTEGTADTVKKPGILKAPNSRTWQPMSFTKIQGKRCFRHM